MKKTLLFAIATGLAAGYAAQASATTVDLSFAGGGIDTTFTLTYGAATDSKVTSGFEVTGISGTFSDSNIGISDASILGLVGITNSAPEPTNLLAPHDFSKFFVATGLPAENHDFLTYDNLYYPGGSPATATDYPAAGGVTDIYGLLFRIGDNRVVDLYSNGTFVPGTPFTYGVGVATTDRTLDYVAQGVSPVPEPGSVPLMLGGVCLIGLLASRRLGR